MLRNRPYACQESSQTAMTLGLKEYFGPSKPRAPYIEHLEDKVEKERAKEPENGVLINQGFLKH